MTIMMLYHGSDKIIECPEFGKGKIYNKAINIDFYELQLQGEKVLSIKPCTRVYYRLKSLMYQAYVYELDNRNIFAWMMKVLMPDWLQMRISHTKFYRLFRKLLFNPRQFLSDSRKLHFINNILYGKIH